jgi:glycosyltransferase involved in cell wall biosynthesis
MITSNSILIVFPVDLVAGHGNYQRVMSMANYLAESGFAIDIVYKTRLNCQDPIPASLHNNFRNIFPVVERNSWSLIEKQCHLIQKKYYKKIGAAISYELNANFYTFVKYLLESSDYLAVIANYVLSTPICFGLSGKIMKILDVHDIMNDHSNSCQKMNIPQTSFPVVSWKTELKLFNVWDVIMAITKKDRIKIQSGLSSHKNIVSVPYPCNKILNKSQPGNNNRFLYFGSDNTCNQKSLSWFLEKVWTEIIKINNKAHLRVSGLISAKLSVKYTAIPNIEWLGYRNDLNEEIKQAGIIVAPYLYGSGVKIKVIESIALGKTVLTTKEGIAGTALVAGKEILVEDDPNKMFELIMKYSNGISKRRQIGEQALHHAAKHYSPGACYAPLIDVLQNKMRKELLKTTVQIPYFRRLIRILKMFKQARIYMYGNGQHTRLLIPKLRAFQISPYAVIDKCFPEKTDTVLSVPVRPLHSVQLKTKDIIILSSAVFEKDMWKDLYNLRKIGTSVIGLYNKECISQNFVTLLKNKLQ